MRTFFTRGSCVTVETLAAGATAVAVATAPGAGVGIEEVGWPVGQDVAGVHEGVQLPHDGRLADVLQEVEVVHRPRRVVFQLKLKSTSHVVLYTAHVVLSFN